MKILELLRAQLDSLHAQRAAAIAEMDAIAELATTESRSALSADEDTAFAAAEFRRAALLQKIDRQADRPHKPIKGEYVYRHLAQHIAWPHANDVVSFAQNPANDLRQIPCAQSEWQATLEMKMQPSIKPRTRELAVQLALERLDNV